MSHFCVAGPLLPPWSKMKVAQYILLESHFFPLSNDVCHVTVT
jgi:hypothetical protein